MRDAMRAVRHRGVNNAQRPGQLSADSGSVNTTLYPSSSSTSVFHLPPHDCRVDVRESQPSRNRRPVLLLSTY